MERAMVVTGANAGIGRAIARQLARGGHPLVLVCRRREAGEEALGDVLACGSGGAVLVVADLATAEGRAAAIDGIIREVKTIAALVHNAGLWPTRLERTVEGFERSYAVNHLAPFALTAGLWLLLRHSAPSRVIVVSAGLYPLGRPNIEAIEKGTQFSAWRTYADTKLCGALFARELALRAQGTGVDVHAVHPGVVNTRLGEGAGIGAWIKSRVKRFWARPESGADAPCWLATAATLPAPSGTFWNERQPIEWHAVAQNNALRAQLWARTERALGQHFDPKALKDYAL